MEDAELLKAARRLDEDAIRTIFDAYSSLIYKYALRLCRDTVEADHIVGDVFARLLEQFAHGKGPRTNIRAYLFQIAYHVIVDRARDIRHISPMEAADFRGQGASLGMQQAEEDAALVTLIDAMNTVLTPDQRHVLVLRFVEGFSIRETAEITGKSVPNVKVIQNRGLAKLRQALSRKVDL